MSKIEKPANPSESEDSAQALGKRLETFNNPDFCCSLGEQLLKKGRPEVALGVFKKAVELDSNSTHGWFGQGMALTKLEEYAESCQYFRRAVRLDPNLAIAHHNLGRSLHEMGQADEAYQCFQESIKLGFTATMRDVAITVPGFPSASNQTILLERRKWADSLLKPADSEPEKYSVDKQKKCLKIGYVSAFFHKQNWMKPVWGLIGQHRIDIALDAFPYNGGTTTTEAIWQGLPVVSYWGDRWVSRTSATLLRSAGLGELVAKDVGAYVRLATQLARDPEKLKYMRQNMRDKLSLSKACDTVAFTRSMENLYREIWTAKSS